MLQAPVTGAGFGPDGRQVLSGGKNGVLRVWNPATGTVTLFVATVTRASHGSPMTAGAS